MANDSEDSRSPSPSPDSYNSDSPPPLPRRRDKDDAQDADADAQSKSAKKYDLSVAVCRDFTRGRCSRSPCRYAHPPPSVAIDGDQVTVCYDSLRDRCARGYGCRYYHPPPHLRVKMQETIGIQATRAPAGYQAEPVMPMDVVHASHSLPSSLPAASPPSQKSMNRPSIEVCRDFVRGRCARRAEECRFAHHMPTGGDGEYIIVCHDFLRGRCQRDACRYFHAPSHLRSRIKDLPGDSVDLDHGGHNSGFEGAYALSGGSYEQQAAKRMRIEDHHYQTSAEPYYGGHGASLYPVSPMPLPPLPPPPLVASHVVHPAPVVKDEDRLPVCRDYLRGKCSRCTACRFVHPESHTQVVDNYVTVCRDSLRGKCGREWCRFHHPPTKHATKEVNGGSTTGDVSNSGLSENVENWDDSEPSSSEA